MTASLTRQLTAREQKFVQYYLLEPSSAEAARKAGYRGKYPHTQAWRVLQREKVQVAIKIEQQRVAGEFDLTPGKVVGMLLTSYYAARDEGDALGMLAACKEISKVCGFHKS